MHPAASVATAPPGGARAWLIWSLGALSFAYAFLQRIAPSVMVQDLMAEFAVGAAMLGNLSAIYLYAYAGLQIPIGVLIDRWGARLMIALALAVAGAGSLLFGTAETLGLAYLGRLLIGVGSAVGFVGTLMLVGEWFPPGRFALLSGLTMTVAMVCTVGAQAPLAALVLTSGWRATLIVGAVAAFGLAAAIALIVRNRPETRAGETRPRQTWGDLARGLGETLVNRQVWNSAVLAATYSAIMLSFGGLWGPAYLALRYDISRPEAAFYTSFVFLGVAVGAPTMGWLTDRLRRRKAPLVAVSTLQLLVALFLFLEAPIGVPYIIVPIFLLGLLSGSVTVCYAYGREVTRPGVEGAVTGFVNAFTVGSGALFQPVIGLLLDLHWDGARADGLPLYALADYRFAFWSLIAVCAVSIACALMLRETGARRLALAGS